jgi:hypothetical protein
MILIFEINDNGSIPLASKIKVGMWHVSSRLGRFRDGSFSHCRREFKSRLEHLVFYIGSALDCDKFLNNNS